MPVANMPEPFMIEQALRKIRLILIYRDRGARVFIIRLLLTAFKTKPRAVFGYFIPWKSWEIEGKWYYLSKCRIKEGYFRAVIASKGNILQTLRL